MEEGGSRESVAVDLGDVSEEIMNKEKAYCDYSGNDLAGGEGGGQTSDGNEESAHQKEEKKSPKEGSCAEDR